jgi:hypothetical protein
MEGTQFESKIVGTDFKFSTYNCIYLRQLYDWLNENPVREEISIPAIVYVLVTISSPRTKGAEEKIRKIKGVKSTHTFAVPFDLVAFFEIMNS